MTTIGVSRMLRCVAGIALVTLAACAGQRDPATPEEKAARGDELLRKMSETLTKAQAFTLSVTSAEPTVPCQIQITYKEEPGQPVSKLVFSNWNLKAQPADSQFVANVPQGFEHIPIVRADAEVRAESGCRKGDGRAAEAGEEMTAPSGERE